MPTTPGGTGTEKNTSGRLNTSVPKLNTSSSKLNASRTSKSGVKHRFLQNEKVKEYLWAAKLTQDEPSATWSFMEEDGDSDYLLHTLFLRHAMLGIEVKEKTRNVVMCETSDWEQKTISFPIASLVCGVSNMCHLDLNFHPESSVKFTLKEGEGPVHLVGQHMVEYPPEEVDESFMEDVVTEPSDEDEDLDHDYEEVDENAPGAVRSSKVAAKRKARAQLQSNVKRGRMDPDEEDSEDDSEADDDEEAVDSEESVEGMEEDDEDMEEDESPKKKSRKSSNGKASKPAATASKKEKKKTTPKAAVPAKVKKVKKLKK